MVQETTDKVVIIKERFKAARDRQKIYVDNRRKPLEFEEGDRVLLKVSPWKGTVRFRKKGKLAPRYVGPFEVLKRIGSIAYRLRLPQELNGVHDTFHVSNLKKCLADANLHVPLDEIKIDKIFCFVEEPVEIMDHEVKSLKCRHDRLVSKPLVIEKKFRRGANRGGASRGTEGRRVVEESGKEADSDLLSDARSRPGPAESSDFCESKVEPKRGPT
ncbi:hypothetical protein Tco_0817162 [Tanacetum coccineum]